MQEKVPSYVCMCYALSTIVTYDLYKGNVHLAWWRKHNKKSGGEGREETIKYILCLALRERKLYIEVLRRQFREQKNLASNIAR